MQIFGVLLLLCSMLYVGLIYFSPAIVTIALISLFVSVCGFIYSHFELYLLKVKLSVPIETIDEGQDVTVKVSLENKFFLMVPAAELLLEVKNSFKDKSLYTTVRVNEIMPGKNEVLYSINIPSPGSYEVKVKKMLVKDMTGLFTAKRRFRDFSFVQVLPKLESVGVVMTESVKHSYLDSDEYDDSKSGHDSSEIFDVREYMPGDRLQRIHWKLSAKMDDLYVKENSLPKACPVALILKCEDKKKYDAHLRLAAAISFSLMDAGCNHYVAWLDGETGLIRRVKVFNEEGVYTFLNDYVRNVRFVKNSNVYELYKEEYRSEVIIHKLLLNDLSLLSDDREIFGTEVKKYEQDLGGLVLVI